MQRPEQHVTDALGQAQLRSALEPLGWTLSPAVDYGIDFDVEVFRGGKSTGVTFKIQLKSSKGPTYSTGGDFISEAIPVKNLRYLIEMQTPTVIVAADVEKRHTFWKAPQNDAELAKEAGTRDGDATITVRIPTANPLPATVDGLLRAVGEAKVVLASRTINTVPVVDFVAALRSHTDVEATIREFRNKAAALAVQQAFQLMHARELDRAEAIVRGVWDDAAAALETKFAAVLVWEQVETRQAIVRKTPDLDRIKLGLLAADRLKSLTESGPQHLKFYTLLVRKIVELEVILHLSWGAFLNIHISQSRGGDPLWVATMLYAWTDYAKRIDLKLRQCFRLVDRVVAYRHRWALADPILRLGKVMFLLGGQLKVQGSTEGEAKSLEQAFQLFRLSAHLAREAGDEQRFADAVGAARLISGAPDSASFQWMTEQLATIQNPEIRSAAADYIARLDRRAKGERLPFEIETSERQIYENMAAGAGVDLSDPKDPIAQVIRIGIADLNPERVLRHCEHIFITLGPSGLVADWMKLPTAGSKLVHCTKHGYAVGTLKLDDGYEALRRKYCASCPDAAPRANDWRYSHEWQREENRRYADIGERFGRRPSSSETE